MHRIAIGPNSPNARYLPKRIESKDPNTHPCMFIAARFTIAKR